jgi:hypothetical protein
LIEQKEEVVWCEECEEMVDWGITPGEEERFEKDGREVPQVR